MHWCTVAKVVLLPGHFASFNVRATMVPDGGGGEVDALPKHQAAMVLEP
jgi:hypothetical protein